MIKQEINEIKRLFTRQYCAFTRICGCYVDAEKNKKTRFGQPFLSLPEEEIFKYLEILRKNLSGTPDRNLLTLHFPSDNERAGSTQDFLLRLRGSRLKDDALLEAFYDKIIATYDHVGSYLILIVHDVYDVPGRTSDGLKMEDASDEVYEYLLACICPVNLSKPGLSYNAAENTFQNRIRDWVVGMPEQGFLFPAFNDRSEDPDSVLYYSKNARNLRDDFIYSLLDTPMPLSAAVQAGTFETLIEETLEETCGFEMVKSIYSKLSEIVEEHKDDPEPFDMRKEEILHLFASSGVANEKLEELDWHYAAVVGQDTALLARNVLPDHFKVHTPDADIRVDTDRTDIVRIKTIDGRDHLVIDLVGDVEVNGIRIKTGGTDDVQ